MHQSERTEVSPIRRHEVFRLHRAQSNDLLICPSVAHNADSFYREEHSECLGDLVVETRLPDLLDVDAVSLLEDLDLLPGDGAKNADGETRTREWMALDEMVGDGEKTTESTNFICKRDSVMMRPPRLKRRTLEQLS